jgi:hypothetical protein
MVFVVFMETTKHHIVFLELYSNYKNSVQTVDSYHVDIVVNWVDGQPVCSTKRNSNLINL